MGVSWAVLEAILEPLGDILDHLDVVLALLRRVGNILGEMFASWAVSWWRFGDPMGGDFLKTLRVGGGVRP